MTLAEQVGVELVDVAALLAADVALPRVGVAVAALVQEVQRRVGERDAAERAHQRQRRRRLARRRRRHAAAPHALRRRCARRLQHTRTPHYHHSTKMSYRSLIRFGMASRTF